jgi:hypothetical protein
VEETRAPLACSADGGCCAPACMRVRRLSTRRRHSRPAEEEGRFDNVAVFEYMHLRGSAYGFDADRPRYLCRVGWEFPFLA